MSSTTSADSITKCLISTATSFKGVESANDGAMKGPNFNTYNDMNKNQAVSFTTILLATGK